jgi:hypothetical protein
VALWLNYYEKKEKRRGRIMKTDVMVKKRILKTFKAISITLVVLLIMFQAGSVLAGQARLGDSPVAFAIASQTLADALADFQNDSGVNVIYKDRLVQSKTTSGLIGKYSPAAGLKKLLAGTGLTYYVTAENTVVLKENKIVVAQREEEKREPAEEREEKVTERPAIELQKTVVTATKTAHALGDVPIGITVITKEELEAANVHNLAEALRMVPGLYQLGKGVKVHGLNIDHTSLLIDGQKQYKCMGRMPIFDRYPIEMIERIEIKKGASSVLSGSETSGGVIHVITRSAPAKPTFSASTGFGTHGKQVHHAGGGSKIDKFGYQIDYTHNKYHGIKPDDEFTYDDVWGSLEYEFTPELKTVLKTSFYNQDSPGWKQRKYSLNSISGQGLFVEVDMDRKWV